MDRSVFISYSHDDSDDVHRDANLLRAGGVKVFIDVLDIAYGDRWSEVLGDALRRCERVLVFWSAAAQVSGWVEREWRLALSLGKRIVPTLLDQTPLPAELSAFQAVRRYRGSSPLQPPSARSAGADPALRGARFRRVLVASSIVALAGAGALFVLMPKSDDEPTGPRPTVPPAPAPYASAPAPVAAPYPSAPAPAVPSPPPTAPPPDPAAPAENGTMRFAAVLLGLLGLGWATSRLWPRKKTVADDAASFIAEVFSR